MFWINVEKHVKLETRDFRSKPSEVWPKINVIIWNHPDKQTVLIQHRPQAFSSTDTVANLFFDTLASRLLENQIHLEWSIQYDKKEFWNLIKNAELPIKSVGFDLITPNMASISEILPKEMRDLGKKVRAAKVKLELVARDGGALEIQDGDPAVDHLVQYSADGGGRSWIRQIGEKAKELTIKKTKTIKIMNIHLVQPGRQLYDFLRGLL